MTMANYGNPNSLAWILPLLNLFTSLLFIPVVFGLSSLFGGVFVALLCLIFGIGTLWQFAVKPDYVAAGLMVPYALAMIVAVYATWQIYVDNSALACQVPVLECSPSKRRRTSKRS